MMMNLNKSNFCKIFKWIESKSSDSEMKAAVIAILQDSLNTSIIDLWVKCEVEKRIIKDGSREFIVKTPGQLYDYLVKDNI